jgi:predicted TIM-barrel fold metal-dependent hydrolase
VKLNFGSFHVPNDCVLDLARKHSCILPAASIHPARHDAIAELERYADAGAAVLKLLPNCHNVQCSLPQYKPFWEKLTKLGIPLLAHTGGEHTVPQYNKSYADPAVLRLPLECGVTVIAAHAATKSGVFDPDYFPSLLKMMDEYPRLFADLSALNLPLRSAALPVLRQPRWQSRVVHGSDFPVPVQPSWAKFRGLISAEEARRQSHNRNLIDRDCRLKVAMGFEEKVFTRIWDLIPIAPRPGA